MGGAVGFVPGKQMVTEISAKFRRHRLGAESKMSA